MRIRIKVPERDPSFLKLQKQAEPYLTCEQKEVHDRYEKSLREARENLERGIDLTEVAKAFKAGQIQREKMTPEEREVQSKSLDAFMTALKPHISKPKTTFSNILDDILGK